MDTPIKIPPLFYKQFSTIALAQELIGCVLVHESDEGKTAGIITETEAYLYNDPASHSFSGKTNRNAAMFGDSGTIYVYFIYGMYHCFNIVSGGLGVGEAVLIRALEPLEGIDLMQKRRNTIKTSNLCSGPAKLVQAMGFKPEHKGKILQNKIYCLPRKEATEILATPRIGITKATDLLYRFIKV